MKEIQLTQGQVALVDDEDFERVSQVKWCACWQPSYAGGGKFVARGWVGLAGHARKMGIYLHQFILGKQGSQIIDHIDGNPLNNAKSNLRFATRSQNAANTSCVTLSRNQSGFRGVSWAKKCNMWRADLSVNAKKMWLGYFTDKLEAAKAYNEAARKYHGEFATLNPIEGE